MFQPQQPSQQPPQQHPQQPPQPRTRLWPWGGTVAVAVVAGLAVYGGMALGDGGVVEPGAVGPAATAGAEPTGQQAAVPRSTVASAGPGGGSSEQTGGDRAGALPTSGILKVGKDIQPGEYAVAPVGESGGYWARLSCTTGDFDCILANDNVAGAGYLTVLPSDAAVRVRNVRLEATGRQPAARSAGPAPSRGSSSGDLRTDRQGFDGRPAARCNADDPAVTIARTADSLAVVCETGVGRYYYKGVRLDDGASIEIDDPVPSGAGFTATNGGVQYELNGSALVITDGSRQLVREPVLQYWSE